MALSGTTLWEVRTTGDDTNNGGAFDPGQTAGMFTDGAATSATGSSPVFTSASYNFVAGDIGAWLYVASGTNWTAGWYQVSSVASNAATLSAAVGAAVLSSSGRPAGLSTTAGCATTGSPTGATWTIDYSQQVAAQFTYTDLASVGSGLLVSSVAKPFNKQQVGNSLVITGGTNFNTGRYVIASVNLSNVATVVGPTNITSSAGVSGTGGLGGALATVGAAAGLMTVTGQTAYAQATATYSVSAAITFGSGLSYNGVSRLVGYTTVRGDLGQPTIQASAGSFTILNLNRNGVQVENFIIDGNSQTSVRGIDPTGVYNSIVNCKVQNCTNVGINLMVNSCQATKCEVTGCSGAAAVAMNVGATLADSWVHDNTTTGVGSMSNTGFDVLNCRITNNTGGSSDGVACAYAANVRNCTIHGNGRDGIRFGPASSYLMIQACISNNLLTNNGGYGINGVTAGTGSYLARVNNNAFYSNTSGARNAAGVGDGDVTLTADPYTASGSNDFSLNSTAGGGAACRGAGYPTYLDVGAVQHQDSGGSSSSPGGGDLGLIIQARQMIPM